MEVGGGLFHSLSTGPCASNTVGAVVKLWESPPPGSLAVGECAVRRARRGPRVDKVEHAKELREAVVRKALREEIAQEALAKEFGVSRSSVQNWLRPYRRAGAGVVKRKERRPQEWSAQERLEALMQTHGLSEEELGAWCRSQGLHTHHLVQWRRELLEGAGAGSKESHSAMRSLRAENRALKKELRRKDKALAETTALLVLKKKAASIWGEPEDD